MRAAPLATLLVASGAAADPLFVTLERADRGSRIGVQSSLQLYPDFDGFWGFRAELHAQHATNGRRGFGAYGQAAIGIITGGGETVTALSGLEVGGLYVSAPGEAVDLVWHLGITLPTATSSDEGFTTNLMTHAERTHDLVNAVPDQGAVNAGVTLRGPIATRGFYQGDLALDFGSSHEPIVHANFGAGRYVGRTALLGEFAASFVDGAPYASLALGARFAVAGAPHVAYVIAAGHEDITPGVSGIVAHLLSVGGVLPL
jgi:hypothetical protein